MNIQAKRGERKDDIVSAEITIAKEDVDKSIAQAYRGIGKNYNFQGFRKGHVPPPVIDAHMGRDTVLSLATSNLLEQADPEIMSQLNIVPIDKVDVGDPGTVASGKDFTFEIKVPVKPELELTSYEPVSITMPPDEVTDAELENQLEMLASYTSEKPELNDEMAKSLGFDSLEALKANLRSEIKKDKEQRLPQIKHERALHALVERIKKDAAENKNAEPNTANDTKKKDKDADHTHQAQTQNEKLYEKHVLRGITQNFMSNLSMQGLTVDAFLSSQNITAEALMADLGHQAHHFAEQSLALDALARHRKIKVTDEDVYNEYAAAGVKDIEHEIQHATSDGRLPEIKESIERNKAAKWLTETAQVTIKDEVKERREKAKKDEAKKSATKKSSTKNSATKKTATKKTSQKSDKDKKEKGSHE